jgi:hypothetical protein
MKCILLPSFEALVPAIQGNEVLDVLNTLRAERLSNDERSLLCGWIPINSKASA